MRRTEYLVIFILKFLLLVNRVLGPYLNRFLETLWGGVMGIIVYLKRPKEVLLNKVLIKRRRTNSLLSKAFDGDLFQKYASLNFFKAMSTPYLENFRGLGKETVKVHKKKTIGSLTSNYLRSSYDQELGQIWGHKIPRLWDPKEYWSKNFDYNSVHQLTGINYYGKSPLGLFNVSGSVLDLKKKAEPAAFLDFVSKDLRSFTKNYGVFGLYHRHVLRKAHFELQPNGRLRKGTSSFDYGSPIEIFLSPRLIKGRNLSVNLREQQVIEALDRDYGGSILHSDHVGEYIQAFLSLYPEYYSFPDETLLGNPVPANQHATLLEGRWYRALRWKPFFNYAFEVKNSRGMSYREGVDTGHLRSIKPIYMWLVDLVGEVPIIFIRENFSIRQTILTFKEQHDIPAFKFIRAPEPDKYYGSREPNKYIGEIRVKIYKTLKNFFEDPETIEKLKKLGRFEKHIMRRRSQIEHDLERETSSHIIVSDLKWRDSDKASFKFVNYEKYLKTLEIYASPFIFFISFLKRKFFKLKVVNVVIDVYGKWVKGFKLALFNNSRFFSYIVKLFESGTQLRTVAPDYYKAYEAQLRVEAKSTLVKSEALYKHIKGKIIRAKRRFDTKAKVLEFFESSGESVLTSDSWINNPTIFSHSKYIEDTRRGYYNFTELYTLELSEIFPYIMQEDPLSSRKLFEVQAGRKTLYPKLGHFQQAFQVSGNFWDTFWMFPIAALIGAFYFFGGFEWQGMFYADYMQSEVGMNVPFFPEHKIPQTYNVTGPFLYLFLFFIWFLAMAIGENVYNTLYRSNAMFRTYTSTVFQRMRCWFLFLPKSIHWDFFEAAEITAFTNKDFVELKSRIQPTTTFIPDEVPSVGYYEDATKHYRSSFDWLMYGDAVDGSVKAEYLSKALAKQSELASDAVIKAEYYRFLSHVEEHEMYRDPDDDPSLHKEDYILEPDLFAFELWDPDFFTIDFSETFLFAGLMLYCLIEPGFMTGHQGVIDYDYDWENEEVFPFFPYNPNSRRSFWGPDRELEYLMGGVERHVLRNYGKIVDQILDLPSLKDFQIISFLRGNKVHHVKLGEATSVSAVNLDKEKSLEINLNLAKELVIDQCFEQYHRWYYSSFLSNHTNLGNYFNQWNYNQIRTNFDVFSSYYHFAFPRKTSLFEERLDFRGWPGPSRIRYEIAKGAFVPYNVPRVGMLQTAQETINEIMGDFPIVTPLQSKVSRKLENIYFKYEYYMVHAETLQANQLQMKADDFISYTHGVDMLPAKYKIEGMVNQNIKSEKVPKSIRSFFRGYDIFYNLFGETKTSIVKERTDIKLYRETRITKWFSDFVEKLQSYYARVKRHYRLKIKHAAQTFGFYYIRWFISWYTAKINYWRFTRWWYRLHNFRWNQLEDRRKELMLYERGLRRKARLKRRVDRKFNRFQNVFNSSVGWWRSVLPLRYLTKIHVSGFNLGSGYGYPQALFAYPSGSLAMESFTRSSNVNLGVGSMTLRADIAAQYFFKKITKGLHYFFFNAYQFKAASFIADKNGHLMEKFAKHYDNDLVVLDPKLFFVGEYCRDYYQTSEHRRWHSLRNGGISSRLNPRFLDWQMIFATGQNHRLRKSVDPFKKGSPTDRVILTGQFDDLNERARHHIYSDIVMRKYLPFIHYRNIYMHNRWNELNLKQLNKFPYYYKSREVWSPDTRVRKLTQGVLYREVRVDESFIYIKNYLYNSPFRVFFDIGSEFYPNLRKSMQYLNEMVLNYKFNDLKNYAPKFALGLQNEFTDTTPSSGFSKIHNAEHNAEPWRIFVKLTHKYKRIARDFNFIDRMVFERTIFHEFFYRRPGFHFFVPDFYVTQAQQGMGRGQKIVYVFNKQDQDYLDHWIFVYVRMFMDRELVDYRLLEYRNYYWWVKANVDSYTRTWWWPGYIQDLRDKRFFSGDNYERQKFEFFQKRSEEFLLAEIKKEKELEKQARLEFFENVILAYIIKIFRVVFYIFYVLFLCFSVLFEYVFKLIPQIYSITTFLYFKLIIFLFHIKDFVLFLVNLFLLKSLELIKFFKESGAFITLRIAITRYIMIYIFYQFNENLLTYSFGHSLGSFIFLVGLFFFYKLLVSCFFYIIKILIKMGLPHKLKVLTLKLRIKYRWTNKLFY